MDRSNYERLMMATCDQFVYTSAKTSKKEGYQIIAKSEGITDNIIKDLTGYYYPVGVKLTEFKESRSLLFLKNNKIAYSIVKNIGTGYDARKGTLYNHTFVIDKEEFRKIDYNSLIFDSYFVMNMELQQVLEKVNIKPNRIVIDFNTLKKLNRSNLESLMKFLILKKKIAMPNIGQMDLIQNLLLLLPTSLRIIPFSTHVYDPERQGEYDLIQTTEKTAMFKLDRSWKIIDLNPYSVEHQEKTDSKLDYFVDLVYQENESAIMSFHREFDKLSGSDSYHKVLFLIDKNYLNMTNSIEEKARLAYDCATNAQKFDTYLANDFLKIAKNYSIEANSKDLLDKIEMGELALLLEKDPLSLILIERILDKIAERNPEIKNLILNKIVKKKKKEFDFNGHNLLRDSISSNSYYKDDILRLFVENKMLNQHVINFLHEDNELVQKLVLLKEVVNLSITYNPKLLPELFYDIASFMKKNQHLEKLRIIIYDIFSNSRNTPPLEIMLKTSKSVRLGLDNTLKEMIIYDNAKTPAWASEEDYEDFRYNLNRILENISDYLLYALKEQDKRIDENTKLKISNEINDVEEIRKKLNNIEHTRKRDTTYRTPSFYDFVSWWWPK